MPLPPDHTNTQAVSLGDVDGDGVRDGDNTANVFVSLFEGKGMPKIDFSTIALVVRVTAGIEAISSKTRWRSWFERATIRIETSKSPVTV